jgi:hypothetical protein
VIVLRQLALDKIIYIDENPTQPFTSCMLYVISADGYAAASLCTHDCMEENLGDYTNSDQVACVASYSLAAYNHCAH